MKIGINQASVFSFSVTPIISVIHFDIPALNVSVHIHIYGFFMEINVWKL